MKETPNNPKLCVTLLQQNAHLLYVNCAFTSVTDLDFEIIRSPLKKKCFHYCSMLCIFFLFFACEKEVPDNPGKPPQEESTANIETNSYDDFFLFGSNMGWLNNNWRDEDVADILVGNAAKKIDGVGAISLRLKLHESFVETWGFDVRVDAFNYYQRIGTRNNVLFIGDEPSAAHRERKQYVSGNPSKSFENLYQPIWDDGENGTPVNDKNYYALYVYELVMRYKRSVKFWGIVNEPDFTSSGCGWTEPGSPCNWWDRDPLPAELDNWHAPIQSYIRMLRVSYEVIKSVDPDAFVCVGGIGYQSFLDAVLRNTDNPDGGKVTDQYPYKGGAWFDCLSFHCYPMYYLRSWGNGGWNHFRHSDAAAEAVINQLNSHEQVLKKYGYDGEYPRKEVIITETNIPNKQLDDYIGSPEAHRNYLIKVAVLGQKNRIRAIHPFAVWDRAEQNTNSRDCEDYMGFYKPLPNVPGSNLRINESGIGWRTASQTLRERRYDVTETAKLLLPAGIEGGAFFSSKSNDYIYVLWAKTSRDLSETASASFTFPSSIRANRLTVTSWNGTATENNGRAITLSGSPVFIKCL